MEIDWEKHHRFMPHSGLCGPTTIWMILDACGIKKSLPSICFYTWKPWYGAPSILLTAFLKRYFRLVNYKVGSSIEDISRHIKLGHIVIINFQDGDGDEELEGHYAIVSEYRRGTLTLIDSSNEHPWKWEISTKKLKERWYDNLTEDGKLYHTGFMVWVDPKSKR
jgi:hypothetical protein